MVDIGGQSDSLAHPEDLLELRCERLRDLLWATWNMLSRKYFANYFLHMSDVTFDMRENRMEVPPENGPSPGMSTLVDTGIAP